MPAAWEEFTARELAHGAGGLPVGCRCDARPGARPGGQAPRHQGGVPGRPGGRREKAGIIARATAVLDPAEARAAEALVLGRAGRLTPAGLRSAIARAVIEVAPEKARERRMKAERDARVERWAEASGNAGLAGRELPPAEVMAADQRII